MKKNILDGITTLDEVIFKGTPAEFFQKVADKFETDIDVGHKQEEDELAWLDSNNEPEHVTYNGRKIR